MRERRYGVENGVPYPSSRRPPSSYREYSPRRRRDGEKYPREAERLRGIERRDGFNRDLNLRAQEFSDKVNRDRDRDRDRDSYRISARRSRSPRRIVRRDSTDKDLSARASDCSVRDRDKYGVAVNNPRRLYEEDLLRGDSTSTKFQWVHLLDVPRKTYGFNVKNYSYTDDYFGVGDTNLTRGGGERDSYPKSQYTDASGVGLPSASQNYDGTKPVLLDYEKRGRMHSDSYSFAHSEIGGGTKSYLGAGSGSNHMPSMASQYLNTDTDKQGYLRFKNEIQLEKERSKGREMLKTKEEDSLLSSRGYLKGDSEHMVSSSRSKDYVPMSLGTLDNNFPGYATEGEIHLSSRGIRPGTGLVTEPFGLDGYGEKQQCTSYRGPGGQFDNAKNYSRLYGGLPEEKLGDHIYPEFGRSTQSGDHLYPEFGRSTKSRDAGEQYGVQHIPSFGHLDSIDEINKSSDVKHMGVNRVWDKLPSSLGGSTSNNFDACGSRHTRKHDLDMLGSGSLHLNYRREAYCGYGSIEPLEHNDEVNGDPWPLFERPDVFPTKEFDPSLGIGHGSLRKGSALADLSSLEPSERRFGGKHAVDDILYERGDRIRMSSALADLSSLEPSERRFGGKRATDDILSEHGDRIRMSSDGSGARMIYNCKDAGNGLDRSSLHKLNKTGTESREMAGYKISSSQFTTSHSSDLHKCGFKDIKKRLGPVPRKLHVSQRLMKKYKPSIKKRLAPVPSKKYATPPWLKSMSSNKLPSIEDVSDENPLDQDGDNLGNFFPIAKPEPPEKSEDFKQLARSAFFKFLKQINETPKIRKKYMEQGKGGSLKCIVCGSNPNEFAGTEKLAMHALTSDKVGLRSQHFGLYKALCLLMGWKSAEEPSSDWHCEAMSKAETSALKEDLIIWPPVMIVHNCSIENNKSSEQVIVSPETLDTKLRVMGFGTILKVSNGKPGNQSVMVVRFNSTLSGLQEAERLHQRYLEKQHGRAHLKQLKSRKNISNSVVATQVLPEDDEEIFLYGYLGIAEDLGKLDFETKKRCVVRSKKEILSIVNASI